MPLKCRHYFSHEGKGMQALAKSCIQTRCREREWLVFLSHWYRSAFLCHISALQQKLSTRHIISYVKLLSRLHPAPKLNVHIFRQIWFNNLLKMVIKFIIFPWLFPCIENPIASSIEFIQSYTLVQLQFQENK